MFRLPARASPLPGSCRTAALAHGLRGRACRNLRLSCRLSAFAAVFMPVSTVNG